MMSTIDNCRYGNEAERMSVEEFERGKEWLSDTFSLIRWHLLSLWSMVLIPFNLPVVC